VSDGPYHVFVLNIMEGERPTSTPMQARLVERLLNEHPELEFQTGYQWPWNATAFMVVMKDPNWKPIGSDRAVPDQQAEAQGYSVEEQTARWSERRSHERV